jgi:hypothetical protein
MVQAAGRRDGRQPDRDRRWATLAREVDRLGRRRPAARPRRGTAALIPAGVAAFGRGPGDPSTPTRSASTSPSARPRTSACSRTSRGCVRALLTARSSTTHSGISVEHGAASQRSLAGRGPHQPRGHPARPSAAARIQLRPEDTARPEGRADPPGDRAGAGRGLGRAPWSAPPLRDNRLTQRRRAWPRRSRRRRATGGPAERTFATLVGLELRPRRLREATTLWQSLTDGARGIEGRDALWAHPDLLPTADDLDDPAVFVHRAELDFDISKIDDTPPPAEPTA